MAISCTTSDGYGHICCAVCRGLSSFKAQSRESLQSLAAVYMAMDSPVQPSMAHSKTAPMAAWVPATLLSHLPQSLLPACTFVTETLPPLEGYAAETTTSADAHVNATDSLTMLSRLKAAKTDHHAAALSNSKF